MKNGNYPFDFHLGYEDSGYLIRQNREDLLTQQQRYCSWPATNHGLSRVTRPRLPIRQLPADGDRCPQIARSTRPVPIIVERSATHRDIGELGHGGRVVLDHHIGTGASMVSVEVEPGVQFQVLPPSACGMSAARRCPWPRLPGLHAYWIKIRYQKVSS